MTAHISDGKRYAFQVLKVKSMSFYWGNLKGDIPYFAADDLSQSGRKEHVPDSKVHGANMGPIWGRQDPGGPHVGPMNSAIWGG